MSYLIPLLVLLAVPFVVRFWYALRKVRGPFSIVLLRKSSRQVTSSEVEVVYQRAFGVRPEVKQIPLPDGKGNGFLAISDQLPPLAVLESDTPYASPSEVAKLQQSLENPTVRAALAEHTCWISVDAMGIDRVRPDQLALVHTPLAKLAAEFYDNECVLLFLRATNRVAAPGDYVEVKLKQGRLDELFGDERLHAPMYHVRSDDKAIEMAKKEARERLPEFLAQCRSRGVNAKPLFKAGFPTTDGNTEFIWLSFSGFQGEELVGVIENEPIDSSLLRKGQSIAVKLEDVIDWAYVDENAQPVGIFVDRLLMQRSP